MRFDAALLSAMKAGKAAGVQGRYHTLAPAGGAGVRHPDHDPVLRSDLAGPASPPGSSRP
ncbi:MAG: hypothetical protein WDM85_03390 [Caulobacteraceae bacterium]